MKEATGELNMTVVTVVAIAAVMAFFYAFVWPSLKNGLTQSMNCNAAYGCTGAAGATELNCFYRDADNVETAISCKVSDLNQ